MNACFLIKEKSFACLSVNFQRLEIFAGSDVLFQSSSSILNNELAKTDQNYLILNSAFSVRNGCPCCCCKCCCMCKCAGQADGLNSGFAVRARSESQCEYSPQERNNAQMKKLNGIQFVGGRKDGPGNQKWRQSTRNLRAK